MCGLQSPFPHSLSCKMLTDEGLQRRFRISLAQPRRAFVGLKLGPKIFARGRVGIMTLVWERSRSNAQSSAHDERRRSGNSKTSVDGSASLHSQAITRLLLVSTSSPMYDSHECFRKTFDGQCHWYLENRNSGQESTVGPPNYKPFRVETEDRRTWLRK